MNGVKPKRHTVDRTSVIDPKLSKKGFMILRAFGAGEKLYGLEIKTRTSMYSGTLYPLLRKLETYGWLEHEYEEGDESSLGRPLRIYYRLTPSGKVKLQEKERQIEDPRKRLERSVRHLQELFRSPTTSV